MGCLLIGNGYISTMEELTEYMLYLWSVEGFFYFSVEVVCAFIHEPGL